jgi:long-chain acyl-CoA synthetase
MQREILTIADILRVHAPARPEAVALVVDERCITFGELDQRSSRAAQAFRAAGVRAGDRVAFIEKNGAEFFDVTFGLAKLGAVAVAVNWRLAAPEMRQIIEDAQADVVVVGPEFTGHIEAVEQELSRVHTVVSIGAHHCWPSFDDWIAAHPADDPMVATESKDIALQLYTSGTTGLPKGVMLSNANLFGKLSGIGDHWRLSADSVNLSLMPYFHVAGASWALLGLYKGCANLVMREIDPAAILAAIPAYRVTNVFMVPVVIQFLLTAPEASDVDLSSLRAIVYGASPITDDVLKKCLATFDCEFIQSYGLTETTGAITQLDAADHDPDNRPELLRSCGKPYPWVEVRIVDTHGNDVATGTVGELWVRAVTNMAGYWKNPAATAATITDDGWLKSGDAGYFDADGYLYLRDRIKDMIVSGGENVYPTEVENVLMTHPEVGDVAVIGVPDDRWGEAVKAVVVPAVPGIEPDTDGLLAFARARLAGYKLPKSVDFVEVLPRNPSGKLLKRELREPYWAGAERRIY